MLKRKFILYRVFNRNHPVLAMTTTSDIAEPEESRPSQGLTEQATGDPTTQVKKTEDHKYVNLSYQ